MRHGSLSLDKVISRFLEIGQTHAVQLQRIGCRASASFIFVFDYTVYDYKQTRALKYTFFLKLSQRKVRRRWNQDRSWAFKTVSASNYFVSVQLLFTCL